MLIQTYTLISKTNRKLLHLFILIIEVWLSPTMIRFLDCLMYKYVWTILFFELAFGMILKRIYHSIKSKLMIAMRELNLGTTLDVRISIEVVMKSHTVQVVGLLCENYTTHARREDEYWSCNRILHCSSCWIVWCTNVFKYTIAMRELDLRLKLNVRVCIEVVL